MYNLTYPLTRGAILRKVLGTFILVHHNVPTSFWDARSRFKCDREVSTGARALALVTTITRLVTVVGNWRRKVVALCSAILNAPCTMSSIENHTFHKFSMGILPFSCRHPRTRLECPLLVSIVIKRCIARQTEGPKHLLACMLGSRRQFQHLT